MATTKRDLVLKIAKQTGVSQGDVYNVIHSLFNNITEGLGKNERFEFRKFGVFETKVVGQRIGRDMKNPEKTIDVPAHMSIRFKPSNLMKKTVRQLQVEDSN